MARCEHRVNNICQLIDTTNLGKPCPYKGNSDRCGQWYRDNKPESKVIPRRVFNSMNPCCVCQDKVFDDKSNMWTCKNECAHWDDVYAEKALETQGVSMPDMAYQQHYESQAIQPIEIMLADLSHEEMRGFLKASVIKYVLRAGKKEGTDDTAKVVVYSKWLDEFEKTNTIEQFSGKIKP